jgi:hypothetical protein
MARDAEIMINQPFYGDYPFDGDYPTAYRELMERATSLALDNGLDLEFLEATALTATVRLAAEIRQGLAAGHLRTPEQPGNVNPEQPGNVNPDCPACLHGYHEHGESAGCAGNDNACPCPMTKAKIRRDHNHPCVAGCSGPPA